MAANVKSQHVVGGAMILGGVLLVWFGYKHFSS